MAEEIEVARVEDYFAHVGVVALKVTGDIIRVGDVLRIKGNTTDMLIEVSSMQVDHQSVRSVGAGDSVGIKVPDKVRVHDMVYKVIETETF